MPFLLLCVSACSSGGDTLDRKVEAALRLAGDNRHELQQVLDNYRDDQEGLEAARFLIGNMPGHYSYVETDRLDRFYDSLDSLLDVMQGSTSESLQSAIKDLYREHDMSTLTTVPDVKVITADFLIANIDRALKQWRTIPWCRSLDFDRFCEYLLPYKCTETQALEPWWEEYEAMTADSLERISSCSLFRISAFQATEVVNNALRRNCARDIDTYEIPPLFYRPSTRLRIPFGTCDELCQAGINAFRAAGIPVAVDHVPVWGYGNRGHAWGVVYAPNGMDMPFIPIHMSPYTQHKINETVAKAYRRSYARNDFLAKVNACGEWVPQAFRNIFQHDNTQRYADVCDLCIDVPGVTSKYVYLCTSSRSSWKPVAVAEVKRGKARFNDVGKGCIFLVVSYDGEGTMIPLTNPLRLDRNGSLSHIKARHDSLIDVTLYRKSPLFEYAWTQEVKIENGVFEAADNPAFDGAVIVGTVDTPADRAGEIAIDATPHRYWRFVQRGIQAGCHVGEISMIQDDSVINRKGRLIGNFPGGDGYGDGSRAFDGDVLTALSFSRAEEAWVGLDFLHRVTVDRIRYYPRSDGNMIEPGDEYELTYWADGQWQSLGCREATTVSLKWTDVPADGIYILLNRTKGDSVRLFQIDSLGRQQWW